MEVGIYLRWIHTGFYSGCFQKWGFEPQWIWKICFQEAQRIENVNVIMITIIVSKTRWWWPYIGWLLVGALNTDITADRPHPPPSSGDIIIDIIITMGIIVVVIMVELTYYSASAPSRKSIKIPEKMMSLECPFLLEYQNVTANFKYL